MAADDQVISWINRHFSKDNGLVVDVGAADQRPGSQSADLIDRGWSAILIEPLPVFHHALLKKYADRPDVQIIHAACGKEPGVATLYPYDGVSTLHKGWRDACDKHWKHVQYGDPIQVIMVTLSSVLFNHHSVDLLTIDTEGWDHDVLLGMDWRIRPEVICVETLDMLDPKLGKPNHAKQETNDLLVGKGYKEVLATQDNAVYLHCNG